MLEWAYSAIICSTICGAPEHITRLRQFLSCPHSRIAAAVPAAADARRLPHHHRHDSGVLLDHVILLSAMRLLLLAAVLEKGPRMHCESKTKHGHGPSNYKIYQENNHNQFEYGRKTNAFARSRITPAQTEDSTSFLNVHN